MTDNEIRRKIVEMLLRKDVDEVTPQSISNELGISELIASGNLEYLASLGYVKAYHDIMGNFSADRNHQTASYLVTPDFSQSSTTINVTGSSNLVAGNDMSFRDVSIVNQSLPANLQEELELLTKSIREGTITKSEQSSRFSELLKKCLESASTSVAVSAATALFKAAIGIS